MDPRGKTENAVIMRRGRGGLFTGLFWVTFILFFCLYASIFRKVPLGFVGIIGAVLVAAVVLGVLLPKGGYLVADGRGVTWMYRHWITRKLLWPEVREVSLFRPAPNVSIFSIPREGILFEQSDGTKILVEFGLTGWREFASLCLESLPDAVWFDSPECRRFVETIARNGSY